MNPTQAYIAKTSGTAVLLGLLTAMPAAADPFFFSTGSTDGKIATATRPESAGKFEIESADDFVLTSPTSITSATFTGLITGSFPASSVGEVVVEIYRVFPNDSDTTRTPNVPTRANSPSDMVFASADSAAGDLTFSTTDLGSFTANNSVQPGGIHGCPCPPAPTTGGNGSITGEEVVFDVTLSSPFSLPADHYFFVPQVEITDPSGDFFWLSAPRPITGGTGPFMPDLQSWTRDQFLDPDWLRVGTDIVGGTPAPTFNASFSLTGETLAPVSEPASMWLLGAALAGMGAFGWRRRRQSAPSARD